MLGCSQSLSYIYTIHWTLYIQLSHSKQCIFFNNVTHEIDRKWVVSPISNIYGKIELVFHLTQKSILYKRLNFQVKRLRILTGKKHPKIKLQRLRKILILTFGSLVHQINSFQEVLKLEQIFQKNKVVTGKTPLFVIGPFCSRHSICLNIGF